MIGNNMNNKGFTLIEALVSIAIFIAISTVLTQIISVSIQNQIKVVITQSMFNQAMFTLDQIEKELRMAKRDASGGCVGVAQTNYGGNASKNTINFLTYDQVAKAYRCKQFLLGGSKIQQKVSTNETSAALGAAVDLTSGSFQIQRLMFDISNDAVGDTFQPKVIIRTKISNINLANTEPIELQTTISQRRLDL